MPARPALLPLLATLALALAAPVAAPADDLSCTLTRACVQGGPCLPAAVPLAIADADGLRPVMTVGGRVHPVDRARNFYGTVYHGWNNARRPAIHPGELWVRPDGRTTYVRRAEVEGVVIRTDYLGRCVLVLDAAPTGAGEALK